MTETRRRPRGALLISFLALMGGCQQTAEIDMAAAQPSKDALCAANQLLHVPSPDWQDQIIYLVFTDRFADGDRGNNDFGVGEHAPSREHFFSGGDIKGLTQQIDYIEGLGATTVWPTPLVFNQWKSQANDFTGYSGYYPVDFSKLDPHFGTVQDYQALSSTLHCRDMYLIKDIVVNHTGNFFGYDGAYDPEDTAKNFVLYQDETSPQPAPTQSPFDMIDRTNPEHYAAGIYNWTPMITDYQNLGERQFTYQLGGLADINTKNPVVIDTFKDTYGDWIEKVGVDAIRIDTVRYVEPDFFTRFMTDEDGIVARARDTGREDFLVFGEVLDYSAPMDNSGEKALAEYLDRPDQKILPAVISFPLKQEIKSIFGQGEPSAQLAYRIAQHMEMFPNPYVTPTMVDNHDVARFLSTGSVDGFKQSFALIFTIPGIPTIYQGSAQGFTETRQAMFAGGYLSDTDHYDTETELYQFIASLSELRTLSPALRRGDLEVLASNPYEAGLFAFRRSHDTETLDVIFNTSDQRVLVDELALPGLPDGDAAIAYALNFDADLTVRNETITAVLPPRAFVVVRTPESGASEVAPSATLPPLVLNSPGMTGDLLTRDVELSGLAPEARDILIVKNGLMESAISIDVAPDGTWAHTYPVANLGKEDFYLVAFDPESGRTSDRLTLRTQVDTASLRAEVEDPRDDDTGPARSYVDLQQPNANNQKDILNAKLRAGGDILQLELTMAEVTSDWLPPIGFDNVSFSIFFDLPDATGARALPQLNAAMPDGMDWDIGHVVFGWGNTMFSADGATSAQAGERFSSAPSVTVDQDAHTITFTYDGSDFGVQGWTGTDVYITTWDIAGEGSYVKLGEAPSEWEFGGGAPDGPRVLDDVLLTLSDSPG
ncbi:MAG: alpha-amylase family glycosyl hydrolase [Henriciella sp.]|nr:alpha-amylase family glycosyl hydrolase [Henriciella sp.]